MYFMPTYYTNTRTAEQIESETEILMALIPRLNESQCQIIAQSSVNVPIRWQHPKLLRIVHAAALCRKTDYTISSLFNRWMYSSRNATSYKDAIRPLVIAAASQQNQ